MMTKLSKQPPKKKKLPTIDQLASIAAHLTKSKISDENANSLIEEAFKLWEAAQARLFLESERLTALRADSAAFDKNKSAAPSLPTKPDRKGNPFPMHRDKFFRKMLPKLAGRPAELAQIAKAYLREKGGEERGKKLTQAQVNRAYAAFGPISETAFLSVEWHFKNWYSKWRREKTSKARSVASSKRKRLLQRTPPLQPPETSDVQKKI